MFEKDDDSNGHIDFITAASVRCRNRALSALFSFFPTASLTALVPPCCRICARECTAFSPQTATRPS